MNKKSDRYGDIPLGDRIADSLLPGLGSDRGFDIHHQRRQTEALERISHIHGDRRIVQEVALRESTVPSPQIYNLQPNYEPTEIINGLRAISVGQKETAFAIYDNTEAVRQSADLVYGGIKDVEARVRESIEASYQIDRHVQAVDRSVQSVDHSVQRVEGAVDDVNFSVQAQTGAIKDGFGGVSPDVKSFQKLSRLAGISEAEIIALGMKGILKRDFLNQFSKRKQQLILQASEYDPAFHAPLQRELETLSAQQRKNRDSRREKRMQEIQEQIEQEQNFIQSVHRHAQMPVHVNTLRILARQGYLDRFVQDEAGEHIREVRTDMYGINQSMREMLGLYEKGHGEVLQQGATQIALQQNISLGVFEIQHSVQQVLGFLAESQAENRQYNETQIWLQMELLNQLSSVQTEQRVTNEMLNTIAWTSNRIQQTLQGIQDSLKDQAENWLGHRRDERLAQLPRIIRAGELDIALEALDTIKKDDPSDPRIYFLKGISFMYLEDANSAEEQLKKAISLTESLKFEDVPTKTIHTFLAKIYSYLGYLHGQEALRLQNEGDVSQSKQRLKIAIKNTQFSYQNEKSLETGIDLAHYLCINDQFDKALQFLERLLFEFPEGQRIILNDKLFSPLKPELQKKVVLNDMRQTLLRKTKKKQ